MTRGEIWWADFGMPFGSEPGFTRPVLIVQDNDFNKSNIKTIVIVPFSTNLLLAEAPGNVLFEKEETGLPKDSVLVTSQLHAIDRERLSGKISEIRQRRFGEIEAGIMLVLGVRKSS
ncbi:MAG: type II toxin-antitoxin system PemK/MazF family toxin [Spirochaetaceae bacterium]